MNCAVPTEVALTWPRFCERGGRTDIHADGWGLAYYQSSSLRQFHDVEPACTSALAQFLTTSMCPTRNLLAHIRYATTGAADSLANVHPFSREMWGIQWCFGHNGQIPMFDDYPHYVLGVQQTPEPQDRPMVNGGLHVNGGVKLGETPKQQRIYAPVGTTDSEAAFCAILNALRAKFTDTMPSLPILYDELRSLCHEIVCYNPDATILNFMLTCGPHLLWVYSWPGQRPGSDVWNGMYYTLREKKKSNGDNDEELCIPNDEENYAVHIHRTSNNTEHNGQPSTSTRAALAFCQDDDDTKSSRPSSSSSSFTSSSSSRSAVCIVATKPLTKDEEWIELERGELLVLDEGIPRVSAMDLFRVELQGHGLSSASSAVLPPPRLEDMRRYRFDPAFFSGGGI
ncbi:hypothetical protein ACA910_003717 [Epithemia clementina (nom. ined.)]